MDRVDKIRTTDLAIEYLQYQYALHKLSKEEYLSVFMPTLKVRSSLGDFDTDRPEIHSPISPDLGHDANRIRLGVGFRDDEFFQEIKFRPANHDFLDNDNGFKKGAQISFVDTAVRYYPSDNHLALSYFNLIDIISISPRDKFFKPVSWKIATGFTRKMMYDEDESMVAYLDSGGGIAIDSDLLGLWYGMAVADIDIGSGLRGGYAAGAGIKTGIIKNISDNLKCHLYFNDTEYFWGDSHNEFEGTLASNYSMKNNMAIGVELSRKIAHSFYYTEGFVYFNIFF